MAVVAETINLPTIDRSPRLTGDEPARALRESVYDEVNFLRTIVDRVRASLSAIDRSLSMTRLRFLLGAVLVFAAALKADSICESTASVPWYSGALVLAELILAALLFSGAMPLQTWCAAVLCFTCFAIVAGVKLWRGAADCGCFGAVATPPWVALAIDLSVLAALLLKYRERSTPCQITTSSRLARWSMAFGFALIVVVGMKAVVTISSIPSTLAAVDPANWVGQRLPLLDDIEIGTELSSGVWTVVLHRHGCAKCNELLSDVESIVQPSGCRVALVELVPANARIANARLDSAMLLGHLHGLEFNSLPAPLVVQINDGRVVFVGDRFPSSGHERATVSVRPPNTKAWRSWRA